MKEQEYNDQLIIKYLLGNLPKAEAERFDELSFTDDDFAQTLKSVENDLIDAYLHDELRGETLEKFQTHYLASPLRREKVNFAESFQGYAKQNIAQIKLEEKFAASDSKKNAGFFSSFNIFSNPVLSWASAAFVLACVVFGGFWIIKRFGQTESEIAANRQTPTPSNRQLPDQNENVGAVTGAGSETTNENNNTKIINNNINIPPTPEKETPKKTPAPTPKPEQTLTPPTPVIASFVLTPPLRGAGGLQNISFPKETATIRITLKLEGNDYENYRVALTDEAGKNLWQSGNLRSKNEALNVSFPAKLLKPRIYSLVVSGVDSDGEAEIISNYPFKTMLR